MPRLDWPPTQEPVESDFFNNLPDYVKEVLNIDEANLLEELKTKDTKSYEHSLEVAELIREKFDLFADTITREGVSKKDMLRAATLHDIGKIDIPDCVLKDTTTWGEFKTKFQELYNADNTAYEKWLKESNFLAEDESIAEVSIEKFESKFNNHRDLIPLKELFANDDEKLGELKKYDIDSELSFMGALRLHEKCSAKRIKNIDNLENKEIIAELVGSHHDYQTNEKDSLVNSKALLNISVTAIELVHIADVHQALSQKRSYKDSMSQEDILYILMKDTQNGVFKESIAHRWINHSFLNAKPPLDKTTGKYSSLEIWLNENNALE